MKRRILCCHEGVSVFTYMSFLVLYIMTFLPSRDYCTIKIRPLGSVDDDLVYAGQTRYCSANFICHRPKEFLNELARFVPR